MPSTLETFPDAVVHVATTLGLPPITVAEVIKSHQEFLARELRRGARLERRGIIEALRAAAVSRLGDPTKERLARGDVVETETIVAGVRGSRVDQALDRYISNKMITARQAQAAIRFREEFEFGVLGVREGVGWRLEAPTRVVGPLTLSEAQISAGNSFAKAFQDVGETLAALVVGVCCYGESLDQIAAKRNQYGKGSKHERDGLRWLFRAGLDRLGDSYRYPRELIVEPVVEGDLSETISYRHEATGRVSGVLFGKEPWLVDVSTVGELRAQALAKLRERD